MENKFPTEIVSLPSKGQLYPEGNPLSSGELEIRYPTAATEDILTSANLIQSGVVLEKFIESILVDKTIKLDDLLIGDKNAILISSRILAYGKAYKFNATCTLCGEAEEIEFDLTTVEEKNLDLEGIEKGQNTFTFQLPVSKRILTFKLLTQSDEQLIESTIKGLTKFNKGKGIIPELTTRLKRMITAVDGNTDQTFINSFVDNEFLAQDSRVFREHTADMMPDVKLVHTFECPTCDHTEEVRVPMTAQFFWPTSRI